jgi:hypothetical protein
MPGAFPPLLGVHSDGVSLVSFVIETFYLEVIESRLELDGKQGIQIPAPVVIFIKGVIFRIVQFDISVEAG